MLGSYLRLRNCMLGGVIERLDPDATESVVTPGGTRIVRSEEFIQLLTPEGERVDADGFSYDHDDATLAANLRHMVLGRRFDAEATALQLRAGQPVFLRPQQLHGFDAQTGLRVSLSPRSTLGAVA